MIKKEKKKESNVQCRIDMTDKIEQERNGSKKES